MSTTDKRDIVDLAVLKVGGVDSTPVADNLLVHKAGAETITGAKSFSAITSFADGAAATPSIAHTGDLSTGVFFPAADTVAIATAGVEGMRVTSTGNFGIGLTTPTAKLEVEATRSALPTTYNQINTHLSLINSNAPSVGNNYNQNIGGIIGFGARFNEGNGSTGNFAMIQGIKTSAINNNLEGALLFNVASAINVLDERMRITSYGDVGLSDSAVAAVSTYTVLSVKGKANTTGGLLDLKTLDSSAHGRVIMNSTALYVGAETSHPIVFQIAGSEKARILTGGNFGIGVAAPTAKLEVAGNTRTNSLMINGSDISGGFGKAIESFVASSVGYINCYDRDNALAEFALVLDALNFTFKTGATGTGTTRVTITDAGLQVVGAISDTRVSPRFSTEASNATPSVNSDNIDHHLITALAANLTSFTVTGTPTNGQKLYISITDDGTSRTIALGSDFEASSVALPTATIMSQRMDIVAVRNLATSKWRVVGVA